MVADTAQCIAVQSWSLSVFPCLGLCVQGLLFCIVFLFSSVLCVSRDLTTVSPVYNQDSVVQLRAASLKILFYSWTDSVLSGVRGLISELKPEQHNLHLWAHNISTCREQDTLSVQIHKNTNQYVRCFTGLRFKMSEHKTCSKTSKC